MSQQRVGEAGRGRGRPGGLGLEPCRWATRKPFLCLPRGICQLSIMGALRRQWILSIGVKELRAHCEGSWGGWEPHLNAVTLGQQVAAVWGPGGTGRDIPSPARAVASFQSIHKYFYDLFLTQNKTAKTHKAQTGAASLSNTVQWPKPPARHSRCDFHLSKNSGRTRFCSLNALLRPFSPPHPCLQPPPLLPCPSPHSLSAASRLRTAEQKTVVLVQTLVWGTVGLRHVPPSEF